MFMFRLMLSAEEHFQQEPLANELLTLQEHIFQVVQGKKLLSLLLLWKSQNTAFSSATGISELARKPRGRKNWRMLEQHFRQQKEKDPTMLVLPRTSVFQFFQQKGALLCHRKLWSKSKCDGNAAGFEVGHTRNN